MTIASSSSLGLDRLVGDLAQRDDRVLVAVAIDGEVGAARNLARALGREQDQIEPVRDLVDTIFNRNARHSSLRKAIPRPGIWDFRKAAPIACGAAKSQGKLQRMADQSARVRDAPPIRAEIAGNRLELIESGEARLRAAARADRRRAAQSIKMLMYMFNPDRVGDAVRDALVEAARRGVEVQAADRRLRLGGAGRLLRGARRGGRRALRVQPELRPPLPAAQPPEAGRRSTTEPRSSAAPTSTTLILSDRGPEHWRDLWLRLDGPEARAAEPLFRHACSAGRRRKDPKLRSLRRMVGEYSEWRGPLQWKFSGPLSMRNSWWRSIGRDIRRGAAARHDLRLFRSAGRDAPADRPARAARPGADHHRRQVRQ